MPGFSHKWNKMEYRIYMEGVVRVTHAVTVDAISKTEARRKAADCARHPNLWDIDRDQLVEDLNVFRSSWKQIGNRPPERP